MKFLLLTLLFCFNYITPATGQDLAPAEFSVPPVGTKVQWKNLDNGFTWTSTVRAVDQPFSYAYFTETGDERSLYAFCMYCDEQSNNRIRVEDYGKIYPLTIGAKTSVKRTKIRNSSLSWTHRLEVVKEEVVEVSFSDSPIHTFVVEEKIRHDGGKWNGKRTFWYAPSLSQNVKVVDDARDDKKTVTYEVQQYILPN